MGDIEARLSDLLRGALRHARPGFLDDEGCSYRKEFVKTCLEDKATRMCVSAGAIASRFDAIVERFVDGPIDGDELRKQASDLLAGLPTTGHDWEVYIPLENLKLADISALRVGRVEFRPASAVRSDLEPKFTAVFPGAEHVPAVLTSMLADCYPEGEVVGVVSVNAEQIRAEERAVEACNEAINVLRLFTHDLFPEASRCHFGMRGTNIRALVKHLAVHIAGDGAAVAVYNQQAVGAVGTFTLTQLDVERLRSQFHLDRLDSILARDPEERNSLEQAVVEACTEYGSALGLLNEPLRLVWNVVALEKLVFARGEHSSTDLFALRVSRLLGGGPQERRDIYKNAKGVYDARSRIVHPRKTEEIAGHLAKADDLARRAIVEMARRTDFWNEHTNFADWADAARFADVAGD